MSDQEKEIGPIPGHQEAIAHILARDERAGEQFAMAMDLFVQRMDAVARGMRRAAERRAVTLGIKVDDQLSPAVAEFTGKPVPSSNSLWMGRQAEREHIIRGLEKVIQDENDPIHMGRSLGFREGMGWVLQWLKDGLELDKRAFGDALEDVRKEERKELIAYLRGAASDPDDYEETYLAGYMAAVSELEGLES